MNRRTGRLKRTILMILTVSLSFLFAFTPVHADGNTIDTSASGSINLRINNDEWYVEGTVFHLYQVETISSDLKFRKTEAFAKANIDLSPKSLTGETQATADKWMKASSALIKYVRKHQIAENDEKQMYNRSLQFNNLVPGLYLIQGDTGRDGNRTVSYQPVLICVPQRISASDPWRYSIDAAVKSADPTYTYPSGTPGTSTPGTSTTPVPGTTTPGTSTTSVPGTTTPGTSTTSVPGTSTSPEPGRTPVPGESEEETPVPSKTTETSPQPSGTTEPGSSEETGESPEPSSSTDESADTRDSFNVWLYTGVLVAMGVVIGIVIYIRNKERKD